MKRWQSIKTRTPRMYYLDPSDKVFQGVKDMKEGYYILNSFNRWAYIPSDSEIKRGADNERPLRLSDGPWDYADEASVPNKLGTIIKGKSHKFDKSYPVKDKEVKARVLGVDVRDLGKGLRRYKSTGKEVVDNFLNGNIVRAQIFTKFLSGAPAKGKEGLDSGRRLVILVSLDEKNVGYEVEIDADSIPQFERFFTGTNLAKSREEAKEIDKELAQKDVRGDLSTQVEAEFTEASNLAARTDLESEAEQALKRRALPIRPSSVSNNEKRRAILTMAEDLGVKKGRAKSGVSRRAFLKGATATAATVASPILLSNLAAPSRVLTPLETEQAAIKLLEILNYNGELNYEYDFLSTIRAEASQRDDRLRRHEDSPGSVQEWQLDRDESLIQHADFVATNREGKIQEILLESDGHASKAVSDYQGRLVKVYNDRVQAWKDYEKNPEDPERWGTMLLFPEELKQNMREFKKEYPDEYDFEIREWVPEEENQSVRDDLGGGAFKTVRMNRLPEKGELGKKSVITQIEDILTGKSDSFDRSDFYDEFYALSGDSWNPDGSMLEAFETLIKKVAQDMRSNSFGMGIQRLKLLKQSLTNAYKKEFPLEAQRILALDSGAKIQQVYDKTKDIFENLVERFDDKPKDEVQADKVTDEVQADKVTDENASKQQRIQDLAEPFSDRGDLKIVITNKATEWGIPGSKDEQGTYFEGTAYFALDNIADVEEAQKTFVHEVGIHYGLPRIMSEQDYAEFTRTVEQEFPNEVAAFNGDVEEFMADLAESVNPDGVSAKMDRVVAAALKFLRKIPILGRVFGKMSKAELRNFARDALAGLKDKDLRTVRHSRVMRRRKLKPGVFSDFSDADVEAYNMANAPNEKKLTLENIKKNFKSTVVSKVFDALRPIEGAVGKDAYILARLARRAEGVLTAMLEYGGIKVIKDKLTDPNKAYDALDIDMTKKSLFEALKPLGSDAERKRFFAWVAYKRAEKLLAEGRESYFMPEMIKQGVNFNRGQVHNAVTGVTTDRSTLYDRISKDYESFNKQIVDVGVKLGLLDRATADEWDKQFYVPFFRVLEEDVKETRGPANYNRLVGQKGIERLKGSDAPVGNLFDNVLLNAFHIIDASLKNNAAVNAIDAALKIIDPATGVPIAREVSKGTKGAVKILRKGSDKHYLVSDPLFMEALASQHYQPINFPGMDFAIKAKRMFTYGTTLGLPFKVRNAIRDTISTSGTTGVGYNLFDNFFGGMGRLKDREMKARMLVNGGYIQFGHLNSGNPDFARKALEANIDRRYVLNDPGSQDTLRGAWDKYFGLARKVLGRYDDWGNELENANRASLFAKESAKRGSNLLAAYHARDILDFSLSGSSNVVRMFNQLLPFTNARLQGLYKMGRATKDTPQAFFTVAGMVALASLANYLTYKDDDDWKDREEWDKDTYFWFKVPGEDTAFRIPTPHEFGFIGNVAWRSYAAVFDQDPVHRQLFAERMGALIKHELALDPTPQLIKPIKEIMTDRNAFTGRNIEGPALQRLSPTERKRLWTTQTAIGTSKFLNQIPWDAVQLSPVQVEHLIKGYFGWTGQHMLFAVDAMVRMAGDYPDLPGKRLTEYPLAREFFQTTPIKNTTYGNMFYEQLKEMEQAYADIQLNRRIGDFQRANELAESNREKLYLRKILNRKQDIVQELNNRIKLIQNDLFMPADMKRQQIDRLEQMRNNTLRNVVRQYITLD